MKFRGLAVITCLQDWPNPYTVHCVMCGYLQLVVLRQSFRQKCLWSGTIYSLCVLCVSFIRNLYYVSLPDQSMYKIIWINVLVDVCMMCSRWMYVFVCVLSKTPKVNACVIIYCTQRVFWACCNAHRCIFTFCLCIKESVCVHLMECEQVYILPAAVSRTLLFVCLFVCLYQCATFIILCAFLNNNNE